MRTFGHPACSRQPDKADPICSQYGHARLQSIPSLAAGSDGVVKPTPQLKAVSMGVALAGKENKRLAQHVASLERSASLSDNDTY